MSGDDPADFFLSLGEEAEQFFRSSHGRTVAALSDTYPLPVDADEVKRSELHHRLIQFVFSGKNYLGPVKEALQFGQKRRILDLGTGGGHWAIDMADEFPRADVIGIDIAPIQPQYVPPNCEFEICNLDEPLALPYPSESFDLIHARSIHIGIRDYPRLLQEIGRLLRPGGLVLLVEPDLFPAAEKEDNLAGTGVPENGGSPNEFRPPDPSIPQVQNFASTGGGVFPTEREAGDRHSILTASDRAANTVRTATPLLPSGSRLIDAGVDANASASSRDGGTDAPLSTMVTGRGGGGLPLPSTEMSRRQPNVPFTNSLLRSLPMASTASSSAAGASSSSQSPSRAATNRRHLDFILNPIPQSPILPHLDNPQQNTDGGDNRMTIVQCSGLNPYPSVQQHPPEVAATMRGWTTLWSTFRGCLQDRRRGIDVTVPLRLGELLVATDLFEDIAVKRANVPVGFWHPDPNLLTIGQLQWMDYELLIHALRFTFLSSRIPYDEVDRIIKDAQHYLYNPPVPFFAHIHVAYASKRR